MRKLMQPESWELCRCLVVPFGLGSLSPRAGRAKMRAGLPEKPKRSSALPATRNTGKLSTAIIRDGI